MLKPGADCEPQIPRTMSLMRSKFGERAFSYAGPAAWNSLAAHLRAIQEISAFRRRRKTHLFSLAFSAAY